MFKILKYVFFDLVRGRWTYAYFGFYFIFTLSLLFLSDDLSKVVISLMNVVLMLCPLIATLFGVMYYYHSREFTELLLAQPIRRDSIFLGQYIGIAASLSACWVLGCGLPFIAYGVFSSDQSENFVLLLVTGVALSFIFSALSFLLALHNENRIRGFGLAIVVWLFFAIIYDGLLLLALSLYSDYPLEKFSLLASMLNPIDLSRILILLKLDISALMGFTGAVFRKFMGTDLGMVLSFSMLVLWMFLPVAAIIRVANRKDF